ncbi:hypothetical protein V7S43_002379 [Phytophthora oleae]|uniref:Dynein heavy chain C-terminal domain-containing protein n=1 Tax=Phytophthora oleae TaxID=2107226 RepID=A0ABD3G7H1_9STRA
MPVTSTTKLLITKAWSGVATPLEVAQPELALLDATQSVLRWCLQSATQQLCYWLQRGLVESFRSFQDKLPMGIYAHSVFPGN